MRPIWTILIACALAPGLTACSVKSLAVNALGDALAKGGGGYGKDDDPELVGAAVPFALKTVESLLDESPRHKGLLFAAVSGFTQYAFAWVQQEGDLLDEKDFTRATELRGRAKRLYRRALGYGLRGLEVDFPGLRARLTKDPEAALAGMRKEHVGLLYWTGLAWGGAISLSKEDSELTADQNLVEAIERRALALDEGYEHGSIHDFFIAWEGGHSSTGGSLAKAREHLARARELSRDGRAAPFVTFAESVSIPAQDRKEFESLLQQALAVDPQTIPTARLSNLIYQKRARWLLSRAAELFE